MLWKSVRLSPAHLDQEDLEEIAKALAAAEGVTTVPQDAAQGHAVRPMAAGPFSASAAGEGVRKDREDREDAEAVVEKPTARVRTGRERVSHDYTFRGLEDPVREEGKHRWGLGPSAEVAEVVSAQQEPL